MSLTPADHAIPQSEGSRSWFRSGDLALSFLDFGGPDDGRPVLLALHGHLNEARFVEQGAVPLDAGYRVVALDQRGHGESDHAASYATEAYVDDARALLDHLGIERAVVLGHSLGAANAYHLAAQAPERVSAVVVGDIGAVIDDDLDFVAQWPRRTTTEPELLEAMGFLAAKHRYVVRKYEDGWGVPYAGADMAASQRELNGDHWETWLASSQPVLLVHGTRSPCLGTELAEEMARRRPGTELVHLEAGHAVYVDEPVGWTTAVRDFLDRVRPD